jgi:hypothetical protein
LTLVLTFQVDAQEWRKSIKEKLPAPLNQFEVGVTKLEEVTKKLRKADLVEGDKHYFEFQEFKYALELVYSNNTLTSMNFTFQKDKPNLSEVSKFLEKEKLKSYPEKGASAGRFLQVVHEKGKLIIDPLAKNIYSVELK